MKFKNFCYVASVLVAFCQQINFDEIRTNQFFNKEWFSVDIVFELINGNV
jgi:hypothetical protein